MPLQQQMPPLLRITGWKEPANKALTTLELDPFVTSVRPEEITWIEESSLKTPNVSCGGATPALKAQRTKSKSNGTGNIVPFSPDVTDIPDPIVTQIYVTASDKNKIINNSGRFVQVPRYTKSYDRRTGAVSYIPAGQLWINLDQVERVVVDPDNGAFPENDDYIIIKTGDQRVWWTSINYIDLFAGEGLVTGEFEGTVTFADPLNPGKGISITWETDDMQQTAGWFTANGNGSPL